MENDSYSMSELLSYCQTLNDKIGSQQWDTKFFYDDPTIFDDRSPFREIAVKDDFDVVEMVRVFEMVCADNQVDQLAMKVILKKLPSEPSEPSEPAGKKRYRTRSSLGRGE